jgi:hypothetical protein
MYHEAVISLEVYSICIKQGFQRMRHKGPADVNQREGEGLKKASPPNRGGISATN